MPQSKSKPSRYTPPKPKSEKSSPLWVPVVMTTMLLAGLLVLVLNYLELLPGATPTRYTLLGLVLITSGFFVATTYR